jgi:hypothetical protein
VCVVTDQPECVVELYIGQRYPLGQRNVGAMQPCVHQRCRFYYIIHIDQMQQDVVVCKAGAGSHRSNRSSYAREMQTINNNNPSLALQRLDVRVYDMTVSPASISTAFYFVLRMKERRV